MKEWDEVLEHSAKVFRLNEDNMNELYRQRQTIRKTVLDYAKQWQPISIKDEMPAKEVIAIGYQNECLVGYISEKNGEYFCESDNELLEKVTHFIRIPIAGSF